VPKGVYAAASAMFVESRALDAVARNVANVQTPGYRRETALRTSFAEVMQGRGGPGHDGGVGVLRHGAIHDFGQGRLEPTQSPYDVALEGRGFLRVRDDQGRILLTRAGHFTADAQGRLVTADGWQLQGQGGPVLIPPEAEQVQIAEDGRVLAVQRTAEGVVQQVVDQLRVVEVDAPQRITALSGQYFDPGDQPQRDAAGTRVRQGWLEQSNTDAVGELVDMIALQRRYEAAGKALRAQVDAGQGFSEILRS
jgi:flagellar basal body rod protein FlgG